MNLFMFFPLSGLTGLEHIWPNVRFFYVDFERLISENLDFDSFFRIRLDNFLSLTFACAACLLSRLHILVYVPCIRCYGFILRRSRWGDRASAGEVRGYLY